MSLRAPFLPAALNGANAARDDYLLRWRGIAEGDRIESREPLIDEENGLLLERAIACRPFSAVKIFGERWCAANAGRLPDEMWDYPEGNTL